MNHATQKSSSRFTRRSDAPRSVNGRSSAQGFTLIEMMIVVVIVAILVAVAIVSYTRHIKSSRIVDARSFVAVLQARQEAYFQQYGYYCWNASATHPSYYPALTASEPEAKAWAPGAGTIWIDLGVAPRSNMTFFQYEVVAPQPTWDSSNKIWTYPLDATMAATLGVPVQPAVASGLSQHPWYYIIARENLDGQGACGDPPGGGACTMLWTTSARNDIVTINEGQ